MSLTLSLSSAKRNSAWVLILLVTILAVFVGLVSAALDSVLVLILFLPVIPVIWVLRDYRAGVAILAFILPFASTHLLPKMPGFNLVGYLALATMVSFSISLLSHRNQMIRLPSWLMFLYVLPIVIATGFGVTHINEVPNYMVLTEAFVQSTPARYIKDFLIYPMLTLLWMWMLANAMGKSTQPQRYIWLLCTAALLPAFVLLIAVAILGVSGISVDELASSSAGSTRNLLSITGFHANEIGALLASMFGPLLFLAPAAKRVRERILLWVMLGLVTLALLLTFSRGAYVSAAVAVLVFLFRSRGSPVAKMAILVTMVIMVLALGGALATRVTEGWYGSASSEARATAVTASRTYLWNALWPEVVASPVIGSGLRSTAWSSAAKSSVFPTHPHNLYLEILLDMGSIGLIVLLMFYRRVAVFIHRASLMPHNSPLVPAYLSGAFASFLGYLVSAVANGHYTPAPENTFLWASFGVALACSAAHKADTGVTRGRKISGCLSPSLVSSGVIRSAARECQR